MIHSSTIFYACANQTDRRGKKRVIKRRQTQYIKLIHMKADWAENHSIFDFIPGLSVKCGERYTNSFSIQMLSECNVLFIQAISMASNSIELRMLPNGGT